MHVVSVRPTAGWRWVRDGFRLLATRPLALLGITVLFLFTVVLPTVLPQIGGFAPLFLTPALAVGYMQAVRTVAEGGLPPPWILYAGLRAHGGTGWRPLLLLGLFNCVLTAMALGLSAMIDGGTLFRIATGAIGADDPGLRDTSLLMSAMAFVLLYTPVQMAMWFAPMFVGWHRVPPVKALFFSLVAVWRNKGAFAVYMLGWFGVAVALSIVLQVLAALVPASVLPLLLSPLSLAMLCALYCSFWPSYRDVIGGDEPPAPATPGEP